MKTAFSEGRIHAAPGHQRQRAGGSPMAGSSPVRHRCLRVVEVDVSTAAYDDWHIDGAVLWNAYADLKDAHYRLAGTAALARPVARSGIAPDSTAVFYGYALAVGVWLMKLYGHPDVRILDCSRDTWRARGYPWSAAASEPPTGASASAARTLASGRQDGGA